ncbi:MAG: hypothetical protein KJ963_06515 [Bacteroidetes bacterium]|nr:hypothetical protein [Bacteroidota bacterium]MBU1423601.1 hypothetical protein [Bacteroidota bacterium]MBU2636721.1 hypothetical protein [Bacteroidota bacterium]
MVVLNNAKLKMKNEKKLILLNARSLSRQSRDSLLEVYPDIVPTQSGQVGTLCSLLIALSSLLIALSSPLIAQPVVVSARIDTNNILIGDQVNLHINLEYPKNAKITWPQIPDLLEGFEIINRTQPVSTQSNQKIIEKSVFTITAFDTGIFIVPPLTFVYSLQNDTTHYFASTSPLLVRVHSVGVDTTAEIKDIKPPLSVPITLAELLPYLIGIVVAGLIIYLIYYLKKRKKTDFIEIFSKPKRPAHEVALESLQSLEAEKLWQRGEVKLYHSKLSDIIRIYIENRFDINAMESTTGEILVDLHSINLNGNLTDSLREMLTLADLVKFAKAQPLPNENDLSLKIAYEFVQRTIPQPQPDTEEKR